MTIEIVKHKNPTARKFSRFAVVRFKTGKRWLVGNVCGYTLTIMLDLQYKGI
jgi:hypothetical protein